MTRTIQRSMARMVVAGGLTVAALFGSVAVAGAASADEATTPTVTSAAGTADDAAEQAAKDAEEAEKEAAKAAAKAAKEAEEAAKKAAEEARKAEEAAKKAAEDAAKEAEKAAKEAAKEQVEYVGGDVVDKIGSLVKAKAPQLSTKYDEIAPALRNLVATALTNKGVTVIYDSRARLVIAPYLCNPKKLKILQPGCVTTLIPGGGRF
jgi:hypothetical protein